MIAPDKHTEIRTSIPYVAGLILKEITHSGIIKYDDLRDFVMKEIGQRSLGDTFECALAFLYLLNRIVYNQSSDSFTLTA